LRRLLRLGLQSACQHGNEQKRNPLPDPSKRPFTPILDYTGPRRDSRLILVVHTPVSRRKKCMVNTTNRRLPAGVHSRRHFRNFFFLSFTPALDFIFERANG
jgi:hypothetical protein